MPGVISSRERLRDISHLREGDFRQVPYPVVLQALARFQRTVVLEVRRGPIFKRVVVEFGVPVDCRSNLVHETLGRFMVAQGLFSEEQLRPCLNTSLSEGILLGEILIEQDLIKPAELYRVLQQNLAKKLLDLFSWTEATFHMLFDVPKVESALKLKVGQLILTGITRFSAREEVERAVAPLVGERLALHPAGAVALGELRLSPEQHRLTDILKGRERVEFDALAAESGMAIDELNRLLYALSVLGIVVPEECLVVEEPAGVEGVTAPERLRSVESAPAAAEVERLTDELMQLYLDYRRRDAFDLLQVPEEAGPTTIQDAYLGFAHKFDPARFGAPELASLAEKARDLFLAGAEAYAELADSQRRTALLERRRTLREERQKGPPAGPAPIETELLDPEVQYEKGRRFMDAGRWKKAIELLEFASDCDPQNGLYRAELAFCRFLAAPETAGPKAVEELREALRIDPGCGLAIYYRGEIHASLGEEREAEACLRQAIRMMSPDRRPIEALKGLSGRRKKSR